MNVDTDRLAILLYPAPVLRRVAEPIASIDESVRAVAARMIELMHEAEGAGLAAPQVGLPWRMFVTRADDRHPDLVYVNPRLSDVSRRTVAREEGCLSVPGVTAEIRRAASVAVTALDLEGNEFTLRDGELLSRVWQHECDHLDGILIIDKMSPMDRIATRKTLKELEETASKR